MAIDEDELNQALDGADKATDDNEKLDFGDDLDEGKGDADSDDAGDGEEGKGEDSSDEKEGEEAAAGEGEEGEGEGDGDGKRADDGKDEEKKVLPRVPYPRFKAMVQKANDAASRVKALEDEITRLKGSKSEAETKELDTKLDDLYEKVEQARGLGKTQEAAKIQREIDTINRQLSSAAASTEAAQVALAAARAAQYDSFVEAVELKFPELNPESEHYDEDMAEEVRDLTSAYIAKGMPEVAALKKAMVYIYRDEDVLKNGTAASYEKKEEKVAPKNDKKEKVAAERKNVAGRVATANKTPPRTEDAGRNNGTDVKIDVTKMSDDDWDKLPESTKARMRGDFL
jgi:hypothetical protein